MIQTNTPDRIDGKDFVGDRWAAYVILPDPPYAEKPLLVIRTLEGKIMLGPEDARALAEWLTGAVTAGGVR